MQETYLHVPVPWRKSVKITRPPKRSEAFYNMIVYGMTGVGKTHLLGSAQDCPTTSPTLILNIDGGLLTLADQKIAVVNVANFKELQEVYDFLRNENTKYKSVAMDTLTEEQRVISMGSITGEVDDDLSFTDLGKSTPPTRQDWLKSSHQMRKLIRAFRDLSYHSDPTKRLHVFMTAAQKVDETMQRGAPALPGALALEAGGYVDVLGHLVMRKRLSEDGTKETTHRFLYAHEHTDDDGVTYLGKNRLGRLGRGVWDPTVAKLIELWTGE